MSRENVKIVHGVHEAHEAGDFGAASDTGLSLVLAPS
jgi:hypothetical protein